MLARAGATSPAGATVPAIPDAEESGDGAIFALFLLHVHDKGLKLMFRKTDAPYASSASDSSEARWPPWEGPRAQPPRCSLVVLRFINQFSRGFSKLVLFAH